MLNTPPGGAIVISAGGGRAYAFNNLTTTPGQVVGPNPSRQSITFHNPGSNDLFVAPVNVQNNGAIPLVTQGDTPLIPSTSSLGGCFRVYANGGPLLVTGSLAQVAWQAFSASGTGNPLTVLDSNT